MTTEAIKAAIYAEMVEGRSLLEAKVNTLHYLTERLEVAAEELKTELTR